MRLAESSGAFRRILNLQTKYCMWLICAVMLTKLPSSDSEITVYSLFHDINSVLLPLKCKEYFYFIVPENMAIKEN